jgi:hypothetical protein
MTILHVMYLLLVEIVRFLKNGLKSAKTYICTQEYKNKTLDPKRARYLLHNWQEVINSSASCVVQLM